MTKKKFVIPIGCPIHSYSYVCPTGQSCSSPICYRNIRKQAVHRPAPPHVIRMEYAEGGIFEDHASLTFINRNLSVPRFIKKIKNGWLEIKTSALTLRYKIGTVSFNTRNLRIDYFHKGKRQTWNIDRVNAGNLKCTTRTLDRCEGNVLYLSITKDTLQLEDGIDFWWLDWQQGGDTKIKGVNPTF